MGQRVYVDLDLPDYEQFLIDLETARDGRTFNPAEVDSIQPARRPDLDVGNKEGLTKWRYRQCDWDNE